MTDARLRLKINVLFEEKDYDKDREKIEDYVAEALTKAVEDVRISIGPGAGAIFVLLEPDVPLSSKMGGWSPERLAKSTVYWLVTLQYVEDVTIQDWIIRPRDGDEA